MHLRTLAVGAVTAAGALTLTALPALAGHDTNPSPKVATYGYALGDIQPAAVPDGDPSGSTRIKALPNGKVQVIVEAHGLAPNLPHAMHFHGVVGDAHDHGCPGPGAAGEDGVVTVLDGLPFYGDILTSLTTTGDTTAGSALALDRFPVADEDGTLVYSRTFDDAAAFADAGTVQVVVHGIDLDGNGVYAFNADDPFASRSSSLSENIPLEVTVPALCGGIAN